MERYIRINEPWDTWQVWKQWEQWELWEQFDEIERVLAARGRNGLRRERRVVPDRTNPFTALTDSEFIERFRLRKESVNDIIVKIRDNLPDSTDKRGCRVPPYLQVLLVLATMASRDNQAVVADCYDVSQALVSQTLARVALAIARLVHQYIRMPKDDDLLKVREEFFAIAGMPGVIGCIDCTHIPIIKPSRDDAETFKCREGYYSLNIQAICGPDLKFNNIVVRWPGSVDNDRIFENSVIRGELHDGRLPGHLLGDSGYAIRSYLLTPLSSPNGPKEEHYNASHIKTRNTIERAFGTLKHRFACLGSCLRTDLKTTQAIIVASAILHNIAIASGLDMKDEVIEAHSLQNVNVDVDNFVVERHGGKESVLGRLKQEQIIRDYF